MPPNLDRATLLYRLRARVRRVWRAYALAPTGRAMDEGALRRALLPEVARGDLPSCLRATATPFHLDPTARDRIVATLDRDFPAERARIVAVAERIADGRLALLGHAAARTGDTGFDWHRDPATGHMFAHNHFSRIDYLGLGRASGLTWDVKRVWELSRQQWLTPLGQAYWLTGEERFAESLLTNVESWIAANPCEIGVNWCVGMEAALRLVAWGWAWHFVRDAYALTEVRALRWLAAVWEHARFVEENLEYTRRNGNHLIADGLGLMYAGAAFPWFRRSRGWLARGWGVITTELPRQVYPDGGDYEGSTSYHRFVMEMGADAWRLAGYAGLPRSSVVQERLSAMARFSAAIGEFGPGFGDSDDGFVWRLGERHGEDHRAGIGLIEAAGLGPRAPGEGGRVAESTWMREALPLTARAGQGSASRTTAFPETGLYVLARGRWRVIVDCGHAGMGPGGHGGHGHNDALAIVAWLDDQMVLCDPGTYTYTGDLAWRDAFRRARAHNTLVVDGAEPAALVGPWSIAPTCVPRLETWSDVPDTPMFAGSHSGFERLPGAPRHRRTIALTDEGVEIVDEVVGSGRHEVTRYWHFAPDAALAVGPTWAATDRYRLSWGLEPGLETLFVRGDEERKTGWISPSYGARVAAAVLEQRIAATLPLRLTARLSVLP